MVTDETLSVGKNGRYTIVYSDKTLTCRDCGTQFSFTASEQAFFAEKGFTNQPGRCPACRAANRGNGGGNRGASRGYGSEPRQMYDVVCAECGRNTQVPFQPRNDRPVYCSDCFRNHDTRGR